MKHTPIPWIRLEDVESTCLPQFDIRIEEQITIAAGGCILATKEDKAFIVRAVNNHEKLLEVVKWSYSRLLLLGQYEGRNTAGGQKELAALRDVIAAVEDIEPEDVQNDFEEATLIKNTVKQGMNKC